MKFYTNEHEWVMIDGESAFIGISEHAAKELGDVTFIELPAVGDDFKQSDPISVAESVKAASDIYTPISGTVIEVNESLDEDPSIINNSAEEKGWICKLGNVDPAELDNLLDEEKYQEYLKTV